MMRSSVMAVMLALAGVAAAPLTSAQNDRIPTEQAAASYSDGELKSFAAAAANVHRINSTYLPKLAEATPEEQRQLERQAMQETTQAVQQQGLTSEKYDEILTAAQTKPDVAKKVQQFLDETPRPGTTQL